MEEQILLKTSTFGGFEKKGVLSYIDEMNAKASQAQEALNHKLDEVSAARDDLTRQVSAFSEKITNLEEQLKNERVKINQLTGVINDLNSEITTQKRTVQERENEIRREQERNRQLQFKAEALEYKSRKYDEATMRVGAVLIEAKESADRILDRAKEEAAEIRATNQRNMEAISGEIESFRVDVSNLRSSIEEVMGSIALKLDGLDESIDEIENRCCTLLESGNALADAPDVKDQEPAVASPEEMTDAAEVTGQDMFCRSASN